MLRASWLHRLQSRFLSARNVKLAGGRRSRRAVTAQAVENLEPRLVLSVDANSFANLLVPTPPVYELAPAAHPDLFYTAPHGQPLANRSPFYDNDVLPPFSTLNSTLPQTAPSTPGVYSYSYQVTAPSGATSSSAATVVSTNAGPADRVRFVVMRPTGVPPTAMTPASYYTPQLPGGQFNSNATVYADMAGFDPEHDALTAMLTLAPTSGTVTLTLYPTYAFTPDIWLVSYASPFGTEVAVTFQVTFTDPFGASGISTYYVAATNATLVHWSIIASKQDVNYWGSNWDAPVTGNVLGNDIDPNFLTPTVTWPSSLPAGLSVSSDGSYSFFPPNIEAFMTGASPVNNVSYTASDAAGALGGASLSILPKIFSPGEGATGRGYSVGNGQTGYGGRLLAYPSNSGDLVLTPLDAADYVVGASGGGGLLRWTGAVPSLNLTTNLPIAPISSIGALKISGIGGASVQSVSNSGDVTIALENGNVQSVSNVGRVVSISTPGTVQSVSSAGIVNSIVAGTVGSVSSLGLIHQVISSNSITGSITSNGNIDYVQSLVFSSTTVSGTISAGADASVFAGGGVNGTVSAANDADVASLGSITGLVTAGRDASVVAFGLLAGALNVGRNVLAASLLSSNMTLLSPNSGDVTLFAYGALNSMATAGGNVSATSFGTLQGNYTGVDVSVFSVGAMQPVNVNASNNASAVSWSSVAGPADIRGTNSASLWAAGDIDGSVTSSAGSASAISFGNILSLGGINGATDAVALSVGDFLGSVSAGSGVGGLITLGSFVGGSVLGSDAVVLTQGAMNGAVIAGNDAVALSIGHFGGSVFAGNDATVASFGNFLSSASVTANRDITDIWAAGDINGSFTATRNIGDITSYGSINASFTATGTTGDSSTGQIGTTTAVGSIAGSFSAGTSIGNLLAGGAITATRTAPTLGTVTANDSATASLTPPVGPTSATASVLAALAVAQGMMTQSVNDYITDATQALSDANTALSNAQGDATTALGDALFDLTNNNAQLRFDATDAYNQAATETNLAYSDAVNEAFMAWNDLQDAVMDMNTSANDANSGAIIASGNTVTALDNQLADIATAMAQTDLNVSNEKNQLSTQVADEITRHTVDWNHNAVRRVSSTSLFDGAAFQEPTFLDDYCRFFWNPAPDFAPYQYGSWIVAGVASGGIILEGFGLVSLGYTTISSAYTFAGQATYAFAGAYAPFILTSTGFASAGFALGYAYTGNVGDAVNVALVAAGGAPGAPITPAKQRLVQVTSWAGQGLDPDLNPGRWVQIGGPTVSNFIKTGLWGGKFEFGFTRSFPWIFRWTSSNVPFSNYITEFVSTTNLVWPRELGVFFDTIKGLLGQRIIVP